MADTGWVIPGTGAGSGWTNPGNLTTDNDSTYANYNVGTLSTSTPLIGTNYDFSAIPADAEIDGIEVEVRLYGGSSVDHEVSQLILDGTLRGDDQASRESVPVAWGTVTYGGPTDLWGWTSVTTANIKDSGFGFNGSYYHGAGPGQQVYVNTYRIKIYYTSNEGFVPLNMAAF